MDKFRWVIAVVVGLLSLGSYLGTRQTNPTTGKVQHVRLSPDEEIALGLKAAPEMEAQYGGEDPDPQRQALVQRVGQRLVSRSMAAKSPYRYQFHLLADNQTINAFALPGGQVFITDALLRRLQTEGQLAGVLGHEIGHVVGRHSAEHLAKAQLVQGLGGAAVIASYNPNDPYRTQRNAALAQAVSTLVNLKFGREDELQADNLGLQIMDSAGYDPRAMIGVMEVLQKASQGGRTPEFFSTHPNPGHRGEEIRAAIQRHYPQGVPDGLQK
jgi:predicted Zn-dependent protease